MATMAKPVFLIPHHSHLSKHLTLFDSTSIRPKLRDSPFSQFNTTIKHVRNTPVVPVVRAQSSPGLLKIGIRGVTVSDVRGFGAQGGSTERQGGSEFSEDKFVAKVKMEIVVSKDQVEAVIEKIIEEARTGEIGDGKIFLVPVSDVIRVRTGERGEKAERMTGGRSDMTSAAWVV
ncbi:hypothetical protein GH714_022399 [Hevea brasiliensis]|uniref:Nitrogen regulatory protein P-II homolog n=1 Tax=Hevea brasiliensis TaxID=3981 RepID=A0A6A6NJM1_HEVBR|nr:hypothetical protein GH714_022399 [Hevea brasiliensis]